MRRTYKYQNYAKFYGIPCYFGFDGVENHLRGRNLVYDWLIPPAAWLHNFSCMIGEVLFPEWEPPGFLIQIGPELPEEVARQLESDE